MADEDFDFEPHTPATLHEAGAGGPTGSATFPNQATSESKPVTAHTTLGRSSQGTPAGGHSGASPPGPTRFAHKPYSNSPRLSPSIPVGHLVDASPLRTPVGSIDQRAGAAPIGSYPGNQGGMPLTTTSATGPMRSPLIGSGSMSGTSYDRNDGRFKTEVCRHVQAGTTCPRGAACAYAHSHEELRSPAVIGGGSSAPRGYSGPKPPLGMQQQQQAGMPPAAHRTSNASHDDGGKMGVAMSQAVPQPSWMMSGGSGASGNGTPLGQGASAAIPVVASPIADVMLHPSSKTSSSLPRAGSLQSPAGPLSSSSPRFSGSLGKSDRR